MKNPPNDASSSAPDLADVEEKVLGAATSFFAARGGEKLRSGKIYGLDHAVRAATELVTLVKTPSKLQQYLDEAAAKFGTRNILTLEEPSSTPFMDEDEIAPPQGARPLPPIQRP